MAEGLQAAQAVVIGKLRQEDDLATRLRHQVGLPRDGEFLPVWAAQYGDGAQRQITYHFQKGRVKIMTRVRYSRRPSSMSTLSTSLANRGREPKLPSGPMMSPSPGPTFISAVSEPLKLVSGSSPVSASSEVLTTRATMTKKK